MESSDLKKIVAVDERTAEKDFDRWLETINSTPRVIREAEKVQKVDIIDAICSGLITVDDDGVMKLKLSEPLTGQRPIDMLTFKSRFTVQDIRKAVKRIEPGDNYGMLMAHASVLIGIEVQVIGQFGRPDFNRISSIVSYFL